MPTNPDKYADVASPRSQLSNVGSTGGSGQMRQQMYEHDQS
jgi:hypothetical protein